MKQREKSRDQKRSVTIFGAGVAGLTAAHELVERGFQVEVIDPDIREEIHTHTTDRGIGGMARSQWGCLLDGLPAKARSVEGDMECLETGTDLLLNDVIVFDAAGEPSDERHAARLLDRAAALITRLVGAGKDPNAASVLMMIVPSHDAKESASTKARVAYVRKALKERLAASRSSEAVDAIEIKLFDPVKLTPTGQPVGSMDGWLFFHLPTLQLFPAEHGFRFFPSFYRHVFDSLRRIPIRNPQPHERTHKSVLENLVPSEGLGFARAGTTKSFLIPRREIKSLEDARHYLKLVLSELGYELGDIERFGLKLLEYMTSSTERRAGAYEHISWGRFVEQQKFSAVSREHIEYGPQMSAALRGSLSDARTQGNISVQLILDQLRSDGQPDCLLNGPTNSAWLDHWHDYLTIQGVEFRRGTLADFQIVDGEIVPVVYRSVKKGKDGKLVPVEDSRLSLVGDAFILALSLPAATEISRKFLAAAAAAGSELEPDNDFARVLAFAGDLDADLQRDAPEGPLQHLSGIQFYFERPINFWRGHTQYLDSAWGLTSIAQHQFWGRARDWTNSYRGVLSVDIGIWDRPFANTGKTAWQCTRAELAAGAWAQILDHHDDAFHAKYGKEQPLPTPAWYAIDTNLVFATPKKDRTPFLVNRVGAYPKRPGKLIDDWCRDHPGEEPPTSKDISYYEVHLDKYVLIGTYMKTYTRLTSMEGANESARHGVNALLRAWKVPCDLCEIWDPEDNEIANLQWLRDLDAKRFEDGRPHILTTLGSLAALDVVPGLFSGVMGGA